MTASRLEGLAALVAGAGLGAMLARRLIAAVEAGPLFRGSIKPVTERAAPVAANLGRIYALLGEIRVLMSPRAGPAGPAAGAPGAPESYREAQRPPGTDAVSAPGRAAGRRHGRTDAWRTPDRIGYGGTGDGMDGRGLLALCAVAAGAAAVYFVIRRSAMT